MNVFDVLLSILILIIPLIIMRGMIIKVLGNDPTNMDSMFDV